VSYCDGVEMSADLSEVAAIATRAHAGQKDKLGEPYIGHPVRVARRVSSLGEGAMMAALLHDVLEDGHLGPGVAGSRCAT
jgi:(p)ppGpp synthase/HD superfamily hydrolase